MTSTAMRGHGQGFSSNPATRPSYSKGSKHLVVDASKFEAEPLPRETRGFQPRQIRSSAGGLNGNTTSAAPSGAASHDTQAWGPTTIKAEPLPHENRGVQPRQSQKFANVTNGNMTSATPAGTRPHDTQAAMPTAIKTDIKTEPPASETRGFQPVQFESNTAIQHGYTTSAKSFETPSHDSQAEVPTAIDKSALKTIVTNSVIHPDRAPGLSDSKWAPKPALSSLAGLRPHPEPAPTWDDSNGFTPSQRLGIDLNELPRHAWNGGVDPMRTSKNGNSVVNSVVQRGREAAVVTVKPPENGLPTKASELGHTIDKTSNGEPSKPDHLLPPHLRPAKPKKAAPTTATPAPAVQSAKDQSAITEASSLKKNVAHPSPKGKGKALPDNGSPAEGNPKPQEQGWDQPVAAAHPLLNAWDGSRAPPPEDWEYRTQDPIPKKERKASFQTWLDSQSSEPVTNKNIVDITAPEFVLGTGVVHENSIISGPSDLEHSTRRLPNDPLTLARVEQTAQAKVDEHKAKFKEQVVEEEPTKEERKAIRAAMRQQNIEFAKQPNPYKPVADIYIRPAERKDIPQIVEIYNYYIKTSAVAMELEPMNAQKWTERMNDCRAEGFDMFVAVQKTATANGQNRRAHAREEPIFGLTYAEGTYGRNNSGRFTATVQVYVNRNRVRIGVGRCLMDRVMTMLNFNHDCKPGVEYIGEKPLMQREVKKVVIEIPYWEDHEEERALWVKVRNEQTGEIETKPGWKTRLLNSLKFEYVATMQGFGFKQACLDKSRTVSIATFVLDTKATLSDYRDFHQ